MLLSESQKMSDVRTRTESGFSLFELVVTMAVLAVLVMGTVPIAQNALSVRKGCGFAKRFGDRGAIDDSKRDTIERVRRVQ